jgi:hypothetical protein
MYAIIIIIIQYSPLHVSAVDHRCQGATAVFKTRLHMYIVISCVAVITAYCDIN